MKLTTHFDYAETGNTLISPDFYIFDGKCIQAWYQWRERIFIDISLREHVDGKVEFATRNSFFPKSTSDKSGSGIGLELVKRKLELLYPDSYLWHTTVEKDIYSTVLVIDTKKKQDDTQLLDHR